MQMKIIKKKNLALDLYNVGLSSLSVSGVSGTEGVSS